MHVYTEKRNVLTERDSNKQLGADIQRDEGRLHRDEYKYKEGVQRCKENKNISIMKGGRIQMNTVRRNI